MSKPAAITFFHQSTFTVAIERTLLIFSYRETDLPQLEEAYRLSEKDFMGFQNIVVFVPRNSLVHHDPVIYTWKQSFPITYVISEDARKDAPNRPNVRVIDKGGALSVAGVQVKAYGSTDAGISLMVKACGIRIFHAGDLNLWHWREENTLREIAQAEELFYQVVSEIPKDPIDICMFPVDPNLGGFYDAGANHFIMTFKPRVFFPMHWGNRAEIAQDYARRMRTPHTQVYALTQPRETALIDFAATPLVIRNADSERRASARGRTTREQVMNLSAYIPEDPFSETDLPVDINK